MPSRLHTSCLGFTRSTQLRSSQSSHTVPFCLRLVSRRRITSDEKPLPKAEQAGPGPNQDQLPHVSEEAAATGKITGEGGPEIEQGTPVQEVRLDKNFEVPL